MPGNNTNPMIYHCVFNNNKNSVLYVGTLEQCRRYVRDNESNDNCEVINITDVSEHSKRLYLYEME